MYQEFFGFHSKPFELLPNPRFLFPSASHRRALSYLHYGLKGGAGFILLTGEVGSGKTTLLRHLIHQVDAKANISMVFNTRIDAQQLLAAINEDFSLDPRGKDKRALLSDLNDFLIAQHCQGQRPIIIIDEAQNLGSEALEEVRLLSNLEAEDFKLVQIILVGQPELRTIIGNPALRQLRQRIGVNCHIDPLSREETEEYVLHRLEVAGNRAAVLFEEGSFDLIHRFCGGIPRLINLLCDFILLAAFSEQTRCIDTALVSDVAGDLEWKEAGGSLPGCAPAAVNTSTLATELLRRIGSLENLSLKSSRLLEEFQGKFAALEVLAREREQQQRLARRAEETLRRLEQTLNQIGAREAEVDRARETATRARSGFLARLFGGVS